MGRVLRIFETFIGRRMGLKLNKGLLAALLILLVWGCVAPTEKEDSFSHGAVQLNLIKGETTQNEVIQKFGPPNIATLDGDGNEIWTYQKRARISQSSIENATITLGEGTSTSTSGTVRAMTLIIKFDESKIVSDFKSMYSSF